MTLEAFLFFAFLVALVAAIVVAKLQSRKDKAREVYWEDGFFDPNKYGFALTDHARERMAERLGIYDYDEMTELAFKAYKFGKSARQTDKKTAAELRRIEKKNGNSVVLLYDGYIYIFSKENVLITVYEEYQQSFSN